MLRAGALPIAYMTVTDDLQMTHSNRFDPWEKNVSRAAWCLALVMTLPVLGCSSAVKRDGPSGDPATKQTAGLKYSALNVYLHDQARKQLTDNVKFNPEALKGTIQRLLTARNLLDAGSLHTIDVEITDIRVRSNFAAVMFGFFAGSDSVIGNVHVKDANGRPLTRYEVSVSYALGGLAGGQDDARMGWLYEEFAKLAVNELSAEGRK